MSRRDVGGIVDRRVDDAVRDLEAQPADSVEVYNQIAPPLVVIQVTGSAAGGGLGTGVVVNADGAILIALHVVEGAASIEVTFSDGTRSPATIASSDAEHDVAVLEARQLPDVVVPATLGGGARVGDEAFAVGHPLGLVGSLSAGVISGLDRSFTAPGGRQLQGLIQFDAAEDADQLRQVFADLPKDVTTQKERREVTAPFVALGALLAAAAMVASFRWRSYP